MREYSTPLTGAAPSCANLTEDVVRNGTQHADEVVFSRRSGQGWEPVTAAEFLAEVRRTAKGLMAAGVGKGDRVALLSRTRYEWTLLDYAIWYAGGVSVPLYENSPGEQVGWILADSGARAAVVETRDHRDRVASSRDPGGRLQSVWTLEDCGDGAAVGVLAALGTGVGDEELEARRSSVTGDDVATLIYTSGTTGRPKGCILTHANFVFETDVATAELHELFTDDATTLLFLPSAHVFARIIQVGAVRMRVLVGHSPDITHLFDDLQEFRPTFLLAVPRLFEKVFNNASQLAAAEGRGAAFNRATEVAIAYSRSQDSGRTGPLLRSRHALYERLVYRRLRASLGGRCRYAISGGAPLGERLGHFYRGIGVPVFEGYGLTETTGGMCVNVPGATRIGSVGRPLPGTELKVAEDGELLVRGGQVLLGYWHDGAATAEALQDDGWFHTGDLAEIDAEGFVRITGRKNEIIVTAGGKNVAPGVLENRLRAHHLISQAMVVGDGRPYVAALVTIDPDAFEAWARQRGKKGTVAALAGDPELVAEVQHAVDAANATVSQAESIRRFRILPQDWTDEGGQLTPSLKLRRNLLMREFRSQIAELFEG